MSWFSRPFKDEDDGAWWPSLEHRILSGHIWCSNCGAAYVGEDPDHDEGPMCCDGTPLADPPVLTWSPRFETFRTACLALDAQDGLPVPSDRRMVYDYFQDMKPRHHIQRWREMCKSW